MTDIKLIIDPETQTADLFESRKCIKTYLVSTSAKGLGCEEGSNKTPFGLFCISEKFGEHAVPGTVFKSRLPTGEIWSHDPDNPLKDSAEDLILTRILWLDGQEEHNRNTKERYIYIHGTNREDEIGAPASKGLGCVRMTNACVVDLYGRMPLGSEVEILNKAYDSVQAAEKQARLGV